MKASTGVPSELRQLLRLRELRVQAAQRECDERQRELADAEAQVEQRQRRIDDWRRQRTDLADQVVGPAARDIARFASLVAAQREHLDDQLERDEYGLIDDERDRDDAQQRLEDSQALWRRERAREDGVRDLLQDARRERMQRAEQRSDAEAEERQPLPLPGRQTLGVAG